MKKLKKFTIDELEQNYPTIAKQDLQYYVGGSGCGSGYGSGAFDHINYNGNNLQSVVEQIANVLGFDPNIYTVMSHSDVNRTGWCDWDYDSNGNKYSTDIYINPNNPLYKYCNVYDIALVMIHEQQHWDTPHDAGTGSGINEFEAYSAQLLSEYYNYASQAYKESIWQKWLYHLDYMADEHDSAQ